MKYIRISEFSNSLTKRQLVYPGIHSWPLYERDLEKFISVYGSNYTEIDATNTLIFALHYSTVDWFVTSPQVPQNSCRELYYPPLIQFEDCMALQFEYKQTVHPHTREPTGEYSWYASNPYQCLIMTKKEFSDLLYGNETGDLESDLWTVNCLYSSEKYYDFKRGRRIISC